MSESDIAKAEISEFKFGKLLPKLCNPFKKSQIHPPKSVNS